MSEAMPPQELERLRNLDPRGTAYTVAGYKALLAEVERLTEALQQQAADELTRMDEAMEIETAVHAARHQAEADRDRLAARVTELEGERDTWRRAAEAETQGNETRAEMVRRCEEVLAELERRARAAEKTAVADVYCTLWDAHGLLDDALNLTVAAPDRAEGNEQ